MSILSGTCHVQSVLGWIKQADLRKRKQISFYQQQWDVIKGAIAEQMKCELAV